MKHRTAAAAANAFDFDRNEGFAMNLTERFLHYVSFDTQSTSENPEQRVPSTPGQMTLALDIARELTAMGVQNVRTNDNAFVVGEIPATPGCEDKPVIGFLAHMDTAEDASGKDIKARIEKNYNGGTITLNAEKGITMSPADYPSLASYVGMDLIVTDGTTLLGADDKAGVAEIVTMAQYLLEHPEIPHGTVKIAFTPDEEVGGGIDLFDVEGFGAQFAYTVDGGTLGEIEYENFNGADAQVVVHGVSIHPGSSKNAMVNAILLGMEFDRMLPPDQKPCYTDRYEGFFHLYDFQGSVERTELNYIIRDHDMEKFTQKKQTILDIAQYLNHKYGEGTFEATVTDSYYNMKEKILPHMHLIENAKAAFSACGVEPRVVPIRGGTDGARLSFKGLPCPNLSTGGENFHGRFEYIPVQSMEKMVETLVELVKIYAK